MNKEELKKKIIDMLKRAIESGIRYYYHNTYMEVVVDYETLADKLVEAGLKFDVDYSLTATFDHMQQARIDNLALRAVIAETALWSLCDDTMSDISVKIYPRTKTQVRNKQELYDYCIKQAEKKLMEEKKDENI